MSVRTTIRRTAVLSAGLLVVALAPQVAVAAGDASVAFTSPVATDVWDDALSVTVSGTPADPVTENVTRIVVTPTVGSAAPVTLLASDGGLTCVDDVCTGTLTWDATTPTDQLQAELYTETEGVPDSEVLATSATSPFTVAPPTPTVTITDPSPSTGLKGVISIPAVGETDALWTANAPTSLELLVGDTLGTAVQLDSASCAGLGTSVCSKTLTWDSTPETGSFTVWVRMATVIGGPYTDSVVVGIDSPAPVVTLTAPANGQGPETISVSGSTDAALSEYPTTIVVSLDGEAIRTKNCAALTRTCSDSFSYDFTGLTGDQVLTATVTTTEGREDVDTATVAVTSPVATIALTAPATLQGTTTLSVTASTDADLTEFPTSIVLKRGTTTLTTFTCDGQPTRTCGGTFDWDATGLTGDQTLTATVATTLEGREQNDTAVVAVTSPVATIALTAPATLQGTTTLSVTASTDADLTEFPTSIVLKRGATTLTTITCAGAPTRTCSGTFDWDSTGLSGNQTLTATVTTTLAGREQTDTAIVAVTSPVATIDLTAPATLQGATTLSVTASTDADLTEFPTSIVLKRGLATLTTITCAGAPTRTCSGTFDWDSTGLSGNQTLTATVTTTLAGREQTDTAIVAVTSPVATIDLTVPTPTKGVTSISVTASTDSDLTEYPTSIVVKRGSETLRTITCTGAPTRTCGSTFDWDATGLTGTQTLTATVTTTLAGREQTDTVLVSVSTPKPSITFSSPDGGTSLKGVVPLEVGVSVDPALTDDPASVAFYDDDVLIDTYLCIGTGRDCTATAEWDATSLTGAHTLKAVVTTTRGDTNEVTLEVDVDNPLPGVQITDPDGATASSDGLITVVATGTVDAALSDSTATMEILVDDVVQDALTVTCTVGAKTCPATFELDFTNQDGSKSIVVRLTSAAGKVGTDSFTLAVDTPDPTAAVTSALTGSLFGAFPVAVSASTSTGSSDFPQSIQVLAAVGAGAPILLGTVACPGDTHTCSGSVVWDTTLLTAGTRTITARVTTTDGITATSPAKSAAVSNPAIKVSITAPKSNAVIKTSPVGVTVTASTTSPQTDRPRRIRVTVGDVTKEATCSVSAGTFTCTKTLSFPASSWVGKRTVKVEVRSAKVGAATTLLRTATASRTVYAYSGTRVTITSPTTVTAGSTVTLRGRVISTKTGNGIGGVTVRIVRDPALGSTSSTTVTTSSTGAWSLRWTARTNTSISASVVAKKTPSGATYIASSSRSTRQPVRARMVCSVNDSTLARGQRGSGSCFVPDLAVGSPLALRYLFNGSLSTLATGTSRSTTIPFSFTFNARGTYFMRVDLGASSRFVATNSALLPVTVS